MRTRRLQLALTLLDMLIAVAIVAILAGLVLTTLTRIDTKGKEQLCQGTLETLNTALRQFRDYRYEYRVNATGTELEFYRNLRFPPDCNDYSEFDVEGEIDKLLDPTNTLVVNITPDQHDPNDSGSAVMYFFLSQVPDCRETLAAIDQSMLKSDHNTDGVYLTIMLDITTDRSYPWLRVVDPWGTPLRYDYYSNRVEDPGLTFSRRNQTIRSFPLITSAGPDKQFDTNDDLTNREKTEGAAYQP